MWTHFELRVRACAGACASSLSGCQARASSKHLHPRHSPSMAACASISCQHLLLQLRPLATSSSSYTHLPSWSLDVARPFAFGSKWRAGIGTRASCSIATSKHKRRRAPQIGKEWLIRASCNIAVTCLLLAESLLMTSKSCRLVNDVEGGRQGEGGGGCEGATGGKMK